jgi:hypothetical protein
VHTVSSLARSRPSRNEQTCPRTSSLSERSLDARSFSERFLARRCCRRVSGPRCIAHAATFSDDFAFEGAARDGALLRARLLSMSRAGGVRARKTDTLFLPLSGFLLRKIDRIYSD